MRFECIVQGLKDNWIEFDDFWTRDEGDQLAMMTKKEAVDRWLVEKCIGCCIARPKGAGFITDPAGLNWDILGGLDVRLHQFVVQALIASYTEQLILGNASARPLFAISDQMMTARENHQN